MKSWIRKMLIGDTVFTEYSKITTPDDIPEKVYFEVAGRCIEVGNRQWVLCIEPIVMGVWLTEADLLHTAPMPPATDCKLYFSSPETDMPATIKRSAEAVMQLEVVDQIREAGGTLLLLRLKKTHLYPFPSLKTRLLYFRYYRRGGLSFDKFCNFVSPYSYPRRVRLISFRQDEYFNIFPMDLLGNIPGQRWYVFGLRHTNKALARIIETGKIVVSEVSKEHKDILYELGKHHSGNAPSLDQLPFGVSPSRLFGFPIPDLAESYKEVSIHKTMDLGSHMLLWGEYQTDERITTPSDHLFIVHFLHYLYQQPRSPYRLA
jgi:hypothetical protein